MVMRKVPFKLSCLQGRLECFFYPKIASLLLKDATFAAKRNLRTKPPLSILVDSSVVELGTTHGTAWASSGESKWGKETIPTGYLARVPMYRHGSESKRHSETAYLPAIVLLAQQDAIKLCTSSLLEAERTWQPIGRYRGRGWFDHNVFNEISLDFVDELSFLGVALTSKGSAVAKERVRARLDAIKDTGFRELVDVLGTAHSQDIWHLYMADRHLVDYYLTFDLKFMRVCENKRKHPGLSLIKTKMVTPSGLADILGTKAVPLAVLSYQHASCLVRTDMYVKE